MAIALRLRSQPFFLLPSSFSFFLLTSDFCLLPMHNLRIGVPSKGRLSEQAGELLKQAGLSFRRQERSLFARVGEMPIDITFLRTDDIPVLCAEGAIDMGISGSDLIEEANVDVTTRLDLGVGRCKLALCVPEDSPVTKPGDLHG